MQRLEVFRHIQGIVNESSNLYLLFLCPCMSLATILHLIDMLADLFKNEGMPEGRDVRGQME